MSLFTPEVSAIDSLSKSTGEPRTQCLATLEKKASQQEGRLSKLSPAVLKSAANEFAEAEQKLALARQKIADQEALIRNLESKIVEVVEKREQLARFKTELQFGDKEKAAGLVMAALLDVVIQRCPATISRYADQRENFAFQAAIAPFVPKQIERMESELDAALADVRADANREKIELPKLISAMRDDSGLPEKVLGLIRDGFIDGIADGHQAGTP